MAEATRAWLGRILDGRIGRRRTMRRGRQDGVSDAVRAFLCAGPQSFSEACRRADPMRELTPLTSKSSRTSSERDLTTVCRYISQSCRPWNIRFAQELKVPEFVPREVLAGKDARELSRALLAITPDEFTAAFKHSPMKRAKLRGLRRNAAVVLGNIGEPSDASALDLLRADADPLVRGHVAWALAKLSDSQDSEST